MDQATRRMLNDAEQQLLRECAPAKLRKLDEDALVELHTRVRRARNKYSKLYRRRAGERVKQDRGRAKASAVNQRTLVKAEVFEDALAEVSAQLAKVAARSARELRDERLATASSDKGKRAKASVPAARASKKARPTKGTPAAERKTPIGKRASASSRAATRRHQAKRASR
jgi:hypothetical protein